jgi:hypothetical protein
MHIPIIPSVLSRLELPLQIEILAGTSFSTKTYGLKVFLRGAYPAFLGLGLSLLGWEPL